MKFYAAIDMLKNAIRNVVADPLAAAPAQPVIGQVYYDTTLNRLQVFNGTSFGLTADTVATFNGQNPSFYLSRANHTGTQSASTISNLGSTVRGYALNTFAAPTGDVAMAGHKLTGLADPTADGDAATRGWVNTRIESAAAGIDSKPSVRAVTSDNITLSGTQTIDVVSLSVGDRVLVRAQSDSAENGVYVVANGSWSRAPDADQTGEITPGAFWFVEEGFTNGRSQWRVENTGPITLGTTPISINQFGAAAGYTAGNGIAFTGNTISVDLAAGSPLTLSGGQLDIDTSIFPIKYTETIGDGSAASYTVTHNLGTKDVVVALRLTSSDEWIMADWVATDDNTVTITFGDAMAANSVAVTIIG